MRSINKEAGIIALLAFVAQMQCHAPAIVGCISEASCTFSREDACTAYEMSAVMKFDGVWRMTPSAYAPYGARFRFDLSRVRCADPGYKSNA
jgi:hypothetical protein